MLQVSAAPPGPRGRQAPTSPPRLTVHEGQELALGCLARTNTEKHTHLAVSFGRAVPEAPVGRATLQEVVGLRSNLAVEAGAPYAERLAAGELRLGKEGTDRYRMVVGGAQAGDAGTYHCTAAEWIQDPDGSWAQIAEKRAVLAHVDVQTLCKCHTSCHRRGHLSGVPGLLGNHCLTPGNSSCIDEFFVLHRVSTSVGTAFLPTHERFSILGNWVWR